MIEDTRDMFLRLQKEDLAALWTGSAENDSELDATLRVYHRQLSILDRHLEETHQTGLSHDAAEAIEDEAVTAPRRSTNWTASILTELGDVHQPGIAYAHYGRPSLITSAASPPSNVDAITARPLPQVSERPVVRFPQTPVHPVVRLPPIPPNMEERERMKKLMQEKHETAVRRKQEEEAREEIERQDRIKRKVEALITPVEKGICNSSSVSSESATTARPTLKRSANHLAAPTGPPSKKHASVNVKQESKLEPGLSAPKGTIRDSLEDLFQSSKVFSGPTPSAGSAERRGPNRGIPGHKTPRPAPRSDTYRPYAVSGPTVSGVPRAPKRFVTPSMPPTMRGFNINYHRQNFEGLGLLHQSGGSHQELTKAATISTALETVFNAASSEKQRQMLGEVLYPKIERLQPQLAGKFTGMILELDKAEVLFLIANDVALHKKVDEALRLYNDHLKANNVESV